MPVAKRRSAPTPQDRAIADRIARARTANPPRDTEWYERCGELALRLKLDPGDVFEEFDERAAVREYLADNGDRRESERLAFEDVRERFEKQGRLL